MINDRLALPAPGETDQAACVAPVNAGPPDNAAEVRGPNGERALLLCPCCGLQPSRLEQAGPSDAETIAALRRALDTERAIVRGTIRRVESLRFQLDALLKELDQWHAQRRALGTNL